MNLTNKKLDELNENEIQKELAYLWGQNDLLSVADYIPKQIRDKEMEKISTQVKILGAKLVCDLLNKQL